MGERDCRLPHKSKLLNFVPIHAGRVDRRNIQEFDIPVFFAHVHRDRKTVHALAGKRPRLRLAIGIACLIATDTVPTRLRSKWSMYGPGPRSLCSLREARISCDLRYQAPPLFSCNVEKIRGAWGCTLFCIQW